MKHNNLLNGSDPDRQQSVYIIIYRLFCYVVMMQPTFFFSFGRGEQSTLSYVVVSLPFTLCTKAQQLFANWFEKGNSWRRQLTRVIFLSTAGPPT